jgi:hypothetical protein
MAPLIRIRSIHILILIVALFTILFPQFSSALRPLSNEDLTDSSPSLVDKESDRKEDSTLQPINENQLDQMSPSLIAPPIVRISSQEYNSIMDQAFEDSICFKRCHKSSDFHPSDNTAKQWRLLIDQEGHAIFSEIPWESPQQKEEMLDYLFNNARNSKPESAGIGVW